MKKHILLFAMMTALFIGLAVIIKSKYYYYPYPNFIEYSLSCILLIVTFVSLMRKGHIGLKVKLLTGFISIVVLLAVIYCLNFAFEWHPLNLNLPFGASQSFEVDHEPYQWETATPESYGYDKKVLSNYFDQLNQWNRLRGLLVVKDDQLIVEHYHASTTKYSAFNIHSITKSITSALIGLSIQHNYIASERELVLPFFPEYKHHLFRGSKQALTIKDLLSMRGGWARGDGFQTAEECILEEEINAMPDTEFKYFTGAQNILSAIITRQTKLSAKTFADQYLFKPLGIQNGFWREVDGYAIGGDESYYTARDLARFGHMMINKGNVDGQQLLNSTWIDKTLTNYTNTSSVFRAQERYDEVGYGYCWWILKDKKSRTIYAARGKGGQHIILIPSQNIVIVVIQEWNPFQKNELLENKLMGELLQMF